MMHEVRSIPPAPRRARRSAFFAYRWPVLAVGAAVTIIGSLLAWLMFLQAGGKPSDERRLDAGPVNLHWGRVDALDQPFWRNEAQWQTVHYQIAHPTGEAAGNCIAPAQQFAVDDRVQIEVLPDDDHINRIVGTHRHIVVPWCQPERWLFSLVVPGLLLLTGWSASAFRLYHVVVHGDVSVGRVLAIRPVPHVLPQMLLVHYSFRDHRATLRNGSHWVRRRGELGQRLAKAMAGGTDEPLPVLHDRRMPQWNRLLLPHDFLITSPPDAHARQLHA